MEVTSSALRSTVPHNINATYHCIFINHHLQYVQCLLKGIVLKNFIIINKFTSKVIMEAIL